MIPRPFAIAWAVAAAAVTAAGCGSSPPARFYVLDPSAAPDGSAAVSYAVAVGPVTIPASVDQPQLVLRAAPNRVTRDEFNRWASPLQNEIGRVVAADLAVLLGTTRVTAVPLAGFDAAYRVAIDVQRFESTPGDAVVVEAVWVVVPGGRGAARSGHTLAREAVSDASIDALVAAHGRALGTLAADVAAAVRSMAAGGRSGG